MLSHIHATFERHARTIWGDFRPGQGQTVCAHWPSGDGPPDYAYALNAPRPQLVGDAQSVDLPSGLGLGAVYRITRGPGMDASRTPNGIVGSADIAGEPTLLAGYTTPQSRVVDPSEWLAARVIVHEAFHIHQATWDAGTTGQPKPIEYPRDIENAALALLEDAVLAVSPGQPPATAATTLRTFLAIRAARQDKLPEIGWRERFYQRIEGTARFVEERYVRLGGHQIDRPAEEFVTGFDLLDWLGRRRGYSVGASCGELLESAVGSSWRSCVPHAQGPADVAATALGVPDGDHRDRLIVKAKQTFDYRKLLDVVERVDLPNATLPT